MTDQVRADAGDPASPVPATGDPASVVPATGDPASVVPATGEPAARRSRFGVLWTHADFMKFWTGETVSLFGTQVTYLALPLTAIIVLQVSPVQLGVIRFLENVPFLLFALLVGAWVDRRRKRPVMIGSNVARCLLVGLVPILAAAGALGMPVLYLVAFGVGVATVFFDVCWLSYVPSLVRKEQLVEANSKVSTSYAAADASGPALGGVLVQLLGAATAMAADAISYVFSVATLLAIRTEEPRPRRPAERHLLREIREGLHLVLGNRYVRATTAQGGLWNFFFIMSETMFLLYAIRELHFTPALVGLVLGVGAVGGIIGSALASSFSRRFRYGPMIMIACGFGTLPSFGIPAAQGTRAVLAIIFMLVFFLVRFGLATANVLMITLRQTVTPAALMGRMNAASRTVLYTLGPLGGIVGGLLGSTIGLRNTLWVAAVGFVFTLTPLIFSPIPSLRELPPPPAESQTAPVPTPAT
jgi:MFS family permease